MTSSTRVAFLSSAAEEPSPGVAGAAPGLGVDDHQDVYLPEYRGSTVADVEVDPLAREQFDGRVPDYHRVHRGQVDLTDGAGVERLAGVVSVGGRAGGEAEFVVEDVPAGGGVVVHDVEAKFLEDSVLADVDRNRARGGGQVLMEHSVGFAHLSTPSTGVLDY